MATATLSNITTADYTTFAQVATWYNALPAGEHILVVLGGRYAPNNVTFNFLSSKALTIYALHGA
jgi:hypothetical protein